MRCMVLWRKQLEKGEVLGVWGLWFMVYKIKELLAFETLRLCVFARPYHSSLLTNYCIQTFATVSRRSASSY